MGLLRNDSYTKSTFLTYVWKGAMNRDGAVHYGQDSTLLKYMSTEDEDEMQRPDRGIYFYILSPSMRMETAQKGS
jgi:hypothetical protein